MLTQLRCPHCGHEWQYKGDKKFPTCPNSNCRYRVNRMKNRALEKVPVIKKVQVFHDGIECKVDTEKHDHYSGI